MTEGIGIDIGGVLATEENLRSYAANFNEVPEIDGAFEAVRTLVDAKFGDNAYIVSKVSERTEPISRGWMNHHEFSPRTGIPPERIIYCRKSEDKADIAEELGLSHFVDNQLAVLQHFRGAERLYLFQPRSQQLQEYAEHIGRAILVENWQTLQKLILEG